MLFPGEFIFFYRYFVSLSFVNAYEFFAELLFNTAVVHRSGTPRASNGKLTCLTILGEEPITIPFTRPILMTHSNGAFYLFIALSGPRITSFMP